MKYAPKVFLKVGDVEGFYRPSTTLGYILKSNGMRGSVWKGGQQLPLDMPIGQLNIQNDDHLEVRL